jgi:hypothetical protein
MDGGFLDKEPTHHLSELGHQTYKHWQVVGTTKGNSGLLNHYSPLQPMKTIELEESLRITEGIY